ncbi:hypothetical protein [Arthrobacter woluwensis]|uniref:hypothetical protein n=1 Tax=Arthrobacter woluwensis TaxID=156980 RepID=UPI0037F32F6B
MTSKLRRAISRASFRYEDVDICLNGEAAQERDRLLNEIARVSGEPRKTMGPDPAKALLAELEELEASVQDDIITLRFRQLSFDVWNALIAKYPPREGVEMDRAKGYDIVAVTKHTAEISGHSLADGLTEPISSDEWADLWPNVSGGDFDRIWRATTRLNETLGWQGVGELKKASTPAPASTETSD